jgi:hypothetical protein
MSDENAQRMAIITGLFTTLGQRATTEEIVAYVHATARIPVHWLGVSVQKVVGFWDQPGKPKPAHLYAQAYYAAGFTAYTTPCDTVAPTPDRVRWWPAPGTTVPRSIADRWYERPQAIGLPAGAFIAIGSGRE